MAFAMASRADMIFGNGPLSLIDEPLSFSAQNAHSFGGGRHLLL
jgi:hypothetical protein